MAKIKMPWNIGKMKEVEPDKLPLSNEQIDFIKRILRDEHLRPFTLLDNPQWFDFSTSNGWDMILLKDKGECWGLDIEIYLKGILEQGYYHKSFDARILNSIGYYMKNKTEIKRENQNLFGKRKI